MKSILLFGAGKSATVLISYLLRNASQDGYRLTVIDADLPLAKSKIGDSPNGQAISFDITEEESRKKAIMQSDVVISLLPPSLHILVAKDCLALGKHLLTASYVDGAMKELKEEVDAKGLLFLCEMGLDPGIDHMSAKKMIDEIRFEGGKIESFYSHCGGLVAPESDDNPWHYKISWNPRNVVMAGKAGAIFKKDGNIVEWNYEELFAEKRFVVIPGHDVLCWYPNRDSLSYIPAYGLEDTASFIRTTLRHPDFIYGWKNVVELKLTDEQKVYNTDGMTVGQFFKKHMDTNDFSEWLEHKLSSQFDATKDLLSELVSLVEMEQKASEKGIEPVDEFMMVDDNGDLKEVDIDDLKVNAASTLADRMHDASLTLKQLFYLGMDDQSTMINKGDCSAADVLQLCLETKLALKPEDKDRIIMLHEIEFTREEQWYKWTSTLVLDGEDHLHTAMAKTVGLPLGIAARQLLQGKLTARGLCIPITPDIYEPVLKELELEGVVFREEKAAVGK